MHERGRDQAAPGRQHDGAAAVRHLGTEILARVDQDVVAARLSQLPSAALLAELEAIVEAVDSLDPARHRRRMGLWGRLTGRDLIAQAQADSIGNRIRLRLSTAQALASELVARTAELDRLSQHVQQQSDALHDLIARERASGAAPTVDACMPANEHDAALHRRLSHLEVILASWQASVAQISMVRSHVAHLLDRYVQVRDLLVSLWRQRASSEAATAQLDHRGIARLQDALHSQLAALHDPVQPHPAPPGADTARQPKEPSP